MRKLASIVAVLVAATFTPAFADANKTQEVVDKYYNAAMGTGHLQNSYCENPRSGTTETCNADYMKLYDQVAMVVGWEVMYLRSRTSKDPRTIQFYLNGFDRNFDEMKRLDKMLNDRYGPIYGVRHGPPPSATTGQAKAPSQPKVFQMKIKTRTRQ